MGAWPYIHQVVSEAIRPDKPVESGSIESFNGKLKYATAAQVACQHDTCGIYLQILEDKGMKHLVEIVFQSSCGPVIGGCSRASSQSQAH